MLPHAYEFPAAIVIVLGGALACFAGYRLFRLVLAVYGFILGAMLASSVMGVTNVIGMLGAAVIGGIAGALILVFAYFIGIALVGAGLAALIANAVWRHLQGAEPPVIAIILVSVLGAIVAMTLQRYVIIAATAFGGAWTMLVGGVALMGAKVVPQSVSAADAWILYPLNPAPGAAWLPYAWLALGLFGTAVQLGVTGRKRR